jgi:citrate lyase subunit beta/citryl-CoA lyase
MSVSETAHPGAPDGAAGPAAAPARSYLFVPGSRPDRFDKALASAAHAVIVDLEDSVAPDDKDRAREAVAAIAATRPNRVLLRINASDTRWFDADLRAAARGAFAGIVLPKANEPGDVRRVHVALGTRAAILPQIETALGVHNVLAIAQEPGTARLLFGSIDLQLDLGLRDEELLVYRSALVLASRIAGLQQPVDGVTAALGDSDALARDLARSRRLGFGGKLCIHPNQVEPVNAAFRPTADEVAWAERVIAADADAKGAAVAVDGKMVDRPVLLRARAILHEAR